MGFISRIRRTDQVGTHIILRVDELSDTKLDLKLVGSEHSHLYHGSITDASLTASKASTYDGSKAQWRDILRKILLGEGFADDKFQDVEASASVSDSKIIVTVRKNIGGITQRLGAFSLEQDDEREEIDIFDWVNGALATTEQYSTELADARAALQAERKRLLEREKQLDDLTVAKREYEEELLQKFAALLNAKKLKIRDQQRMLAGSGARTRHARDESSPGERNAAARSRGKRKVSDLDEKMSVDGATTDGEQDVASARESLPASDTESGEEDLDVVAATKTGKPQSPATDTSERDMAVRGKTSTTRSQTAAAKPQQAQVDEETDDETDDEL